MLFATKFSHVAARREVQCTCSVAGPEVEDWRMFLCPAAKCTSKRTRGRSLLMGRLDSRFGRERDCSNLFALASIVVDFND